MNFFMTKKGQISADSILNKVIVVVIIATILGGTVGIVLDAFTNLSGSGLVLGVLFATILPLLLAVFAFKSLQNIMKV